MRGGLAHFDDGGRHGTSYRGQSEGESLNARLSTNPYVRMPFPIGFS
jgi:hypothetical protein